MRRTTEGRRRAHPDSDSQYVSRVDVLESEIRSGCARELGDRDRLLHWQPTIATDPPIDPRRIELEFVGEPLDTVGTHPQAQLSDPVRRSWPAAAPCNDWCHVASLHRPAPGRFHNPSGRRLTTYTRDREAQSRKETLRSNEKARDPHRQDRAVGSLRRSRQKSWGETDLAVSQVKIDRSLKGALEALSQFDPDDVTRRVDGREAPAKRGFASNAVPQIYPR
jgi:hypothetical protein